MPRGADKQRFWALWRTAGDLRRNFAESVSCKRVFTQPRPKAGPKTRRLVEQCGSCCGRTVVNSSLRSAGDARMSKSIGRPGLTLICLLTLPTPAWTASQEPPGDYSAALKSWAPGHGKPGLWSVAMSSPAGPYTSNLCFSLATGLPALEGVASSKGNSCVVAYNTGPDGDVSVDSNCRISDPKATLTMHTVFSSSPKRISMTMRSDVDGKPFTLTETMSYLGDCPVSMRPDQRVVNLTLGPDGKFRETEPASKLR